MKKLIYLFMASVLVLTTACDPMEDIHAVIDAQEQVITGEVNFTMSDDDYDFLDLGYGNFNSVEDAKSMIPDLLFEKYPVWGDGSLATVSFNVYAPKKDERSLEIYTVSTADYDSYEDTSRYNNFDSAYQIYRLLDDLYPAPADRLLVSLTYKFYDGGVSTLNNGFLFLNGEWNFIQGFTDDEYQMMGEGYPNFSSESEADIKIPVFLKDKFKFDGKSAGDIEAIMYKLYVGGGVTESYVKYFIYDGSDWSEYGNEISETVKFGHDGSTWVPDNTIKYVLTAADYELVGNGRYGNFDVRAGKDEETVEARLAKINTILLNNFPGMAEGQKFTVIYNVYSGAAEVWEMKVILSGGSYVLQ
jgi:hypothetical protein